MMLVRNAAALFAAISLLSCATQTDEREMNYLASALTKISAAVDATVRYGSLAPNVTDEQVLAAATSHDPALLKNFAGQTVRVIREGENSVVLVCERATGKALLEDAGCTAKMDLHRWNMTATRACEPTLDLKLVCGQ